MRHLVRPSFGSGGSPQPYLAWDVGNLPAPPSYLWAGVADVTASTLSTDVSLLGSAATAALTVPANWWSVGRTINLLGFFRYTTTTVTAGVATVKLKLGSTVIATFTISGLTAGMTNASGMFDIQLTCRSTGSSGTFVAGGRIEVTSTSVAGGGSIFYAVSSSTVTINTTAALLVDLTCNWSLTGNSMTAVTSEVAFH